MDTTQLSDEQIDFLAACESDFANRYTDTDDLYTVVMQIGMSPPPILEPWRPKGGNHYRPERRDRDRDRERDRDRDRGYKRRFEDDDNHKNYRRRY